MAPRPWLYSVGVTLVAFAMMATLVPPPQAEVARHKFALEASGSVAIDFIDLLPRGERVRVLVNVTRGGPVDVSVVQVNETYDRLFAEGGLNLTARAEAVESFTRRNVTRYEFNFTADGEFLYALFLDNRPYARAGQSFDPGNATLVDVRLRFPPRLEALSVAVGLLTTVPGVLVVAFVVVRKARRRKPAE